MKRMIAKQFTRKEPTNEREQMELMSEMMIEQFKMQDEMFAKTQIESDVFEEALMYHVSKDKEVAQKMQEYM